MIYGAINGCDITIISNSIQFSDDSDITWWDHLFRWLLWHWVDENDNRWLGVGMVARESGAEVCRCYASCNCWCEIGFAGFPSRWWLSIRPASTWKPRKECRWQSPVSFVLTSSIVCESLMEYPHKILEICLCFHGAKLGFLSISWDDFGWELTDYRRYTIIGAISWFSSATVYNQM